MTTPVTVEIFAAVNGRTMPSPLARAELNNPRTAIGQVVALLRDLADAMEAVDELIFTSNQN